jgi:type VI secretion system secreted protein Hcp
MALTSYLTLEGNNQGTIDGDCTQKGREKTILVYEVDHMVEIPRDTHTGLPTGQRIHRPFVITKHKDNATPKLFQACCSGEQFKEVLLKSFRINEKGQEEHYFSVKLENAIIVQMHDFKPLTFLPENKFYHDMEKVAFTYEKVIWTYETDGIEAEDNWKEPTS